MKECRICKCPIIPAWVMCNSKECERIFRESKLKREEDIKILTKRKRDWMSMSDDDYSKLKQAKKLGGVEDIKILTGRKRKSLGVPDGKVGISSGGRDFRRELVRMRDKHTCQICKKKWRQGQRRFDVHHKDEDPNKTKQIDSVEEFSNMATLCHRCHLRLHHRRAFLKD
jgi:hypothetical protein